MAWTEWGISFKCKACNRSSYSYIRASRYDKKAIGCRICGLHMDLEIRERFIKVGDLEISIYIPAYC